MNIITKRICTYVKKLESKYFAFRLKNKPHWRTISKFNGCNIWTGSENKIERTIFFDGDKYDDDNFCLVNKLVRPGNVCLDIGANIGIYSVIFSHLSGDPANVHAFEPVNHIREKLVANARLNGFTNLNVNDFALGERPETINMYQVKKGIFRAGTSSFVKNENVQSMGEDKFDLLPVSVKTLDFYTEENKLNKIDFVKIDVEGFEWSVLQGGRQTIAKARPHILLEYDEIRHGPLKQQFAEYFSSLNYDVFEFYVLEGNPILMPYDFTRNPVFRNLLATPR